MFGLDALVALGGLVIGPAYDFIKKKFLKDSKDTPESILGNLALTHPDQMAAYVEAQAKLIQANVEFFNRDVIGQASRWVIDLRAAIRPIGVLLAFFLLVAMLFKVDLVNGIIPDEQARFGIRLFCEAIVSSWFGERLTINGGKSNA